MISKQGTDDYRETRINSKVSQYYSETKTHQKDGYMSTPKAASSVAVLCLFCWGLFLAYRSGRIFTCLCPINRLWLVCKFSPVKSELLSVHIWIKTAEICCVRPVVPPATVQNQITEKQHTVKLTADSLMRKRVWGWKRPLPLPVFSCVVAINLWGTRGETFSPARIW